MRINKFIALATGISRRAADKAVQEGRVIVNGQPALPGQSVSEADEIVFDQKQYQYEAVASPASYQTIMLNKPVGYVVSRQGQGSQTIYDLLPAAYHHLKPIGRLDKNSSGLLLLTNNGQLAHQLTHPSLRKAKIYELVLDRPLSPEDQRHISQQGVNLEDGSSRFQLSALDHQHQKWQATLYEGRKRQIRRTFQQLGYTVIGLHRTQFGEYRLGDLASGSFKEFV
jgi:23S rRNA pseudouridine2605 synthase